MKKNAITFDDMKQRKLRRDLKRPYDELLQEAEDKSEELVGKANHVTLEYYVPLLCERLRARDFAAVDLETSDFKDIKKMRDEIKATVYQDCPWWEPESIKHYWPEWAKDEWLSDLRKAEAEKRRPEFSETTSLKEEESSQKSQKEFNLVSSVMSQIQLPPKPIDKETRLPMPQDKELKSPLELYGDAVDSIADLWKAIADKDNIPTKSHDVQVDYIQKSRKFRLRMLKGLDEDRRAHFHNQLVWLEMLINDTLNMDNQLIKEEDEKPKGGR
jgi:hypothetical protein